MKLLILLAFMTLATCFKPIHADVEVSMKTFSDTSGDSYFKLQSWNGVEIKYQPEKDSLYYFVSYEEARVHFLSPSFGMDFIGLGVGFKTAVTNKINLYGQVGYYISDTAVRGRFRCDRGAYSVWESLHYAMNHKWGPTHHGYKQYFDEYEVDSTNGFGITVGAEFLHPLTKNLDLNFGIEWRAMSYDLIVNAMYDPWNYDETGARWETTFKGTDSTNFKVGLNYAF